jgi:4-hydroxy-2-oxoheptanedioate aldolase
MRYPPLGTRSFGPTRAVYPAGRDYFQHANEQILCIAMIETAEAMINLEEIVTTPGIDAIYVGPSDLSISLSDGKLAPGMDRQEPEMIDAIRKIQAATRSAGIASCLHCASPDYAVQAMGWGFSLCTLNSDARFLEIAAAESLKKAQDLLATK